MASLATGIASSPARNSSARDHGGAMRGKGHPALVYSEFLHP